MKWLIVLLILVTAQANAQTVDFQGLVAEDVTMIKKKYGGSLADPSPAVVDEILKNLFILNHYEDLQAYTTAQGGFRIVGSPIRRLEGIEVRGNQNMTTGNILKILNVKEGDRPARRQILDAIEGLNREYNKLGFLNAVTEISFIDQKGGKVGLVVNVREGAKCIVRGVTFETTNRFLQKDLDSLAKNTVDQTLSQETIDELVGKLREYFVDYKYLNAQLPVPEINLNESKTEASLRFALENPYRFVLFYEGNKNLDNSDLNKALDLKSAERLGFNPGAELADRLKQVYQKRGYASAQITFEERVIAADYTRQVYFKIKEGPRVRVDEYEISGHISKDPKEYSNFIKDHSGPLISRNDYNAEELELGLKNLIVHLQNQGYLKAKVQSTRTTFNKDGSQATIYIFLDEGPLTTIKEIRFQGLKSFATTELHEVTGLKQGSPLHLNVLEESLKKLQDHYTAKGYLDAKILSDAGNLVTYTEDNTEATIVFEIEEGPQVTVASILIEGNELTHEDVFLKEIEFTVGDVLTADKIRDSILRLQRMGLFSRVDIRTLEQGTALAARTIVIDVTERNPGLFNLGSTVNLEVTTEFYPSLRVYSGLAYRNLGGTARALSARGEINANFNLDNFLEHDVTLGYLEPFVFDQRIRGRVNLTRSLNIFKVDNIQVDSLNKRVITALETNQLSFLLEKDLTRNLKLTWNTWSLTTSRKYLPADAIDQTKVNIGTVGPTIEWDKSDHPFLATSGFVYRVAGEYSHPALGNTSGINYIKGSTGLKTYTPLGTRKLVWANSLSGGYLQSLSSNNESKVPEEVMFSLGGRSTVRGFDQLQESIPSRDEFRFKTGGAADQPLYIKDSSTFYLIKTELRFPIAGDFGGVLFYDGGAVLLSDVQFDDPYRDSAGVGIRIETPVGPISFEVAWKLDRKSRIFGEGTPNQVVEDESPLRFHFSIGQF